jgi:predicted acyltransferase
MKQPFTPAPSRLLSLDTLRGFDMFWITGGEEIVQVLAQTTGWTWAVVMATQLSHAPWNGFRAYDLIFPLFLFLAGVSTPYSLGGRLHQGVPRSQLLRKVVRRGLLLVALGILYNNGLFHTPWGEIRYASVLGRIGLAGMFAQVIYLYFPTRTQWLWFGGILLAYWAGMMWLPVPGCGAGHLTMTCNPASYLDRIILPGRMHKTIHDPEGIISTFPAIATALMGIFAGNLLRAGHLGSYFKIGGLMLAGAASLLLAYGWDVFFPINKNLWTSSFVLCAGGWSLLLLGIFYVVVDVLGWRRWTFFFVVIGTNAIIIYLIGSFVDFEYTAEALFGGVLGFFIAPVQLVGTVVAYVAVQWGFMYLLYQNKLFLRI